MAEEMNTSLIVLYSIIFLFIVFLVLEQPKTTTLVTLPLIGDTENIPLTTTIIIAVGVLIVAGGAFLLYKKLNKKKQQLEVPKPENLPELTSQLSSLELPKKEEDLSEEDINKLFIEGEQPKKELISPEKIEKIPQKIQEEKQINYKELRTLIINLLNKNYTRESILNYLKNKGYNLTQIKKVIDGINQSNLARYIGQCISLGMGKNEIIKNLLSRGWNLEEIKKQL